ncbi:MAG TPA: peptide chain release factor 1 [bacterium]|jgi:peptide chain release factor 1|nr:peptide chain release factor 1 [bacterium]HQG13955.1 peptide chain release factor 1 [bacterium]
MFKKLEEVEKRFEDVTAKLSDPSVIANQKNFQSLAKERSDIIELVENYRVYKSSLKELEENREISQSESDPELRKMATDEVLLLESKITGLEERLKLLLLPKDPNDDRNILLEIRAGTGGEEAALFATDLFRMYQRYAEQKNWRVEIMSESSTGRGGIKEIIAMISGDKVYSELKYESGVHRVQRVPETEASGRIHTSACTVAVLPEAEDVDISIDERDLRIDIYRSSGPGGQGVNTTDSAVRITHMPTGLVVACQDERSQHKNRARAMKILKTRLLDMEQQRQDDERSATRKSMIGSGDRSEKIRTYNFPQNRLSDHRIGLTLHNLSTIMEGNLADVITPLRTHYQAEALKGKR